MKLLFDLFPVIVFFIAFKLFNIYVATTATIVASVIQLTIFWLRNKKVDGLLIVSTCLVVILGLTTLALHDKIYIKWKPTAISWAFAIAFFVTQYVGKKPLIEHILEAALERAGEQMELPPRVWRILNIAWIVFYIILGSLNLYVAYHFSDNVWVYFKLFGLIGLTLVFIILQSIYLMKYMDDSS